MVTRPGITTRAPFGSRANAAKHCSMSATSRTPLSLVILRTIDERNQTRPPVPAVHRTGRSAKLPGGLCVSMERPHRAEGLLWARHGIGRPPRNRGTLLGWAGWDFFPMLGKF